MGKQQTKKPRKPRGARTVTTGEGKEVTLSRFQKWPTGVVSRQQLHGAPYNPRHDLDPHARKKLEASLKKFGLAETLVWNKRTGYLVGGHQRLECLDTLEGRDDYHLEVTIVDVDEQTERELNVALNNPAMQSTYDVLKLDELVKSGDFDYTNAGFDPVDLEAYYHDAGLPTEFLDGVYSDAGIETTNAVLDDIETILDENDDDREAAKEAQKQAAQAERETQSNGESNAGQTSEANDGTQDEKLQAIKDRRKAYAEQTRRENEGDFYVTVAFASDAQKQAFLRCLGLDPRLAFVSGDQLASILKLDLEKANG